MTPLEFKELIQLADEERRYFFSIFRLLRKNKLNLLEEEKLENYIISVFFFSFGFFLMQSASGPILYFGRDPDKAP